MTARQYTSGQIEFQETLLVMFFVVIIISIGMFFYYRYFSQNLQDIAASLSEQEASVLLASLTHMAELRCLQGDCIDTSKLVGFSQLVNDHKVYYQRELGSKKIIVKVTYPIPHFSEAVCDAKAYSQTSYPDNCGYYVAYDSKPGKTIKGITVSTPISLYYPETNSYKIGRLEVVTYA